MSSSREQKPYIELSVWIRKENNQYSSWCPELDVASCGDSIEEACENLHDAVDLYLDTLAEEGELSTILQERDIKVIRHDEPGERPILSSLRAGVPTSA
ncbi:MAG: type II toxin-antitoxin system HicB family antitoxin [Dehalococcoidales bacterium]|nr:type II toxin-antitoxin system HicB family antitoxin [Dehalococcoidales bacterium]